MEELLKAYSAQEVKNEEAVYDDEIRAELDVDTCQNLLCIWQCCC